MCQLNAAYCIVCGWQGGSIFTPCPAGLEGIDWASDTFQSSCEVTTDQAPTRENHICFVCLGETAFLASVATMHNDFYDLVEDFMDLMRLRRGRGSEVTAYVTPPRPSRQRTEPLGLSESLQMFPPHDPRAMPLYWAEYMLEHIDDGGPAENLPNLLLTHSTFNQALDLLDECPTNMSDWYWWSGVPNAAQRHLTLLMINNVWT